MTFPLNSDAEIIAYLLHKAQNCGIPHAQISLWVHLEKRGEPFIHFSVSTADAAGGTNQTAMTVDEAIEKFRDKYVPEPERNKMLARQKRQEAEKLLAEADKLSDEPTLPPSDAMLEQIAQENHNAKIA